MSGRVGTIIQRAGGLIIGGPGTTGMWPPMGGLIPGAGGPVMASREGLPCGAQASCQGKEDPGDPGGGGSGIMAPVGGGVESEPGPGGSFPC